MTVRVYVDNKGCRYEVAHSGPAYRWVRRAGVSILDFGWDPIPFGLMTRTLREVTQ